VDLVRPRASQGLTERGSQQLLWSLTTEEGEDEYIEQGHFFSIDTFDCLIEKCVRSSGVSIDRAGRGPCGRGGGERPPRQQIQSLPFRWSDQFVDISLWWMVPRWFFVLWTCAPGLVLLGPQKWELWAVNGTELDQDVILANMQSSVKAIIYLHNMCSRNVHVCVYSMCVHVCVCI